MQMKRLIINNIIHVQSTFFIREKFDKFKYCPMYRTFQLLLLLLSILIFQLIYICIECHSAYFSVYSKYYTNFSVLTSIAIRIYL